MRLPRLKPKCWSLATADPPVAPTTEIRPNPERPGPKLLEKVSTATFVDWGHQAGQSSAVTTVWQPLQQQKRTVAVLAKILLLFVVQTVCAHHIHICACIDNLLHVRTHTRNAVETSDASPCPSSPFRFGSSRASTACH